MNQAGSAVYIIQYASTDSAIFAGITWQPRKQAMIVHVTAAWPAIVKPKTVEENFLPHQNGKCNQVCNAPARRWLYARHCRSR